MALCLFPQRCVCSPDVDRIMLYNGDHVAFVYTMVMNVVFVYTMVRCVCFHDGDGGGGGVPLIAG